MMSDHLKKPWWLLSLLCFIGLMALLISRANAAGEYNADGIAVTALIVTPGTGKPNDDYTVSYTIQTNRPVAFADLAAAVRDTTNADNSQLDFAHLGKPVTINGQQTFTSTRKFTHVDKYDVHIAYMLDGKTWRHVTSPAIAVKVENGPAYNADGIAVTDLSVTPGTGQPGGVYEVSYTVRTSRPVTFTDVTAAVRDSANLDNASLDFAHLSNPVVVNGTQTFTSKRSFTRTDTYAVHVAYTLDGKTWKHVADPAKVFSVSSGTVFNNDGIAITSLSVTPDNGVPNGEYSVSYVLETNRPVRFVDLTAAVRDSNKIDDGHLDFTHLEEPITVSGKKTFNSTRSFNHADTYSINVAYTLDGATWRQVKSPGATVTVAAPAPTITYNADGIAFSALSVTPGNGPAGGQYSVSYTVQTNRPVTLVDLTAAVRDASNIDDARFDFSHLEAPMVVNGKQVFSSSRKFDSAGTYKAHLAYTLDGRTWKHQSEIVSVQVTGSSTLNPTTTTGSIRSGLPFNSGINAHHEYEWKNWEKYRNRPVDVVTVFPARNAGWDGITKWTWHFDNLASFPGKLDIAIPFFPDNSGNLRDCANGAYDNQWKQFATLMVSRNRGNSYIRPAWEFNGDWFPGNMASNTNDWIGCFRKVVTAIRSVAPQVRIEWIMNGHGSKPNAPPGGNAWSVYPGDQYVDVIGIDNYDIWMPARDEVEWSVQCGGLHGPCYIIDQARARKKLFSVPEWGISNKGADGNPVTGVTSRDRPNGGDNPFFIRKMKEVLLKNADIMAHESYFTTSEKGNVNSELYKTDVGTPSPMSPNSAAQYKLLFGK